MALYDVLAKGPQNKFLDDEPVVSFFQTSYAQHTPFSRESVELTVSGQQAFGSTMSVPLNKRGDMVGKLYVTFWLPGIRHKSEPVRRSRRDYFIYDADDSSCCDNNTSSSSSSSSSSSGGSCSDGSSGYHSSRSRSVDLPHKRVYWNNCIAHLILEQASLQIGGQTVCRHWGEWMEIWDEFTSKPGKPTDEMIGRFYKEKDLWLASRRPQIRYAPLRFWFCEHIGKALPILAIHHSNIRLEIRTRDLHECYYSSDGSIPQLIESHQELSPRDLKVRVMANVYYLSDYERDDMGDDQHEYLVNQVQYNGGQLVTCQNSATNAPVVCKLPFQHPVVEVLFVLQDEHHITRKDLFNYSGKNNEDPVERVKMTVNNHERFSEREGKWFRLIEPYEYHTNIPKRHIYSYSFAIFPEDQSFPSGSLNFSRVDDVFLHLVLQRGLGPSLFKCWAISWNVFRVILGLSGMAYTAI